MKRHIKNLALALAITTSSPQYFTCLHAKDSSSKQTSNVLRKFTVTPGYIERTFNSNETMLYGSLNIMQLSSLALDKLLSLTNSTIGKVAIGSVYIIPQSWLSLAGNVVYHEFGHARTVGALGGDYHYIASHSDDENAKSSYAYGLYIQKFLNPAYFLDGASTHFEGKIKDYISEVPYQFLQKFLRNKPKLTTNLTKQSDILSLSETEQQTVTNAFTLFSQAGGLNNNTHYGKAIANLIDRQKGHLFYFFDYFVAKTTPYFYFLLLGEYGDLASIRDAYSENNIHVTRKQMGYLSMASFFLSSTSWSFIYSALNNLPNGNLAVYSPTWKGWRLPDLNFYINSYGLSFELTTGYHINPNWYTGIALESIYHGNTNYEVSPSVTYIIPSQQYGKWEISAQLHIGRDFEFGGNIGASWQSPHKSWEATLKYIYHNALTLNGERNIPFFKSGIMNYGDINLTNQEIAVTLSYFY